MEADDLDFHDILKRFAFDRVRRGSQYPVALETKASILKVLSDKRPARRAARRRFIREKKLKL